jgi:hypothetical protein
MSLTWEGSARIPHLVDIWGNAIRHHDPIGLFISEKLQVGFPLVAVQLIIVALRTV